MEFDLSQVSLSYACLKVFEEKATGVMHIMHPEGEHRAFFIDGIPQGARLARIINPLGQVLKRLNWISEETLNEALKEHHRTRVLLGDILKQKGCLNDELLDFSLRMQSQLNFLGIFGVEEGMVRIATDEEIPDKIFMSPMDPLTAVYEGLKQFAPPALLFKPLAELALSGIKIKENYHKEMFSQLPSDEHAILNMLKNPIFAANIAAQIKMPSRELAAFLYLLRTCNFLEMLPASKVN